MRQGILAICAAVLVAGCSSRGAISETTTSPSPVVEQQFEPNPVGSGETTTQPVMEEAAQGNSRVTSQTSEQQEPVQSLW